MSNAIQLLGKITKWRGAVFFLFLAMLFSVDAQVVIIDPFHQPTLVPSFSPSNSPSKSPSSVPTIAPTLFPTLQPSEYPTLAPTLKPTFAPTLSPSRNPTKAPTAFPTTKSPTESPSANPSASPTFQPSNVPTFQPSDVPTFQPSDIPTFQPSDIPTFQPSKAPTFAPSSAPTQEPTLKPSETPTSFPTNTPTTAPTRLPSETPTNIPSMFPTGVPTKAPSKSPSATPTKVPTKHPTKVPTRAPSRNPTKTPTRLPTKFPTTRFPSAAPTFAPTPFPTLFPTRFPTKSPTKFPTRTPTGTPSIRPTEAPSNSPSRGPSKAPSASPTSEPSFMPTTEPSRAPTRSPTQEPSFTPSESPSKNPTTISPTRGPTNSPTKPEKVTSFPTNAPSSMPTSTGGNGRREIIGETGDYCDGVFEFYPEMDGLIGTGVAFAVLGLLSSVGGIVFVFIYRDRPILLLSQRVFLVIFCVGIAILNLSLIPRLVGTISPSAGSCRSSSFMFYFGLSLSLSCLCVKEWRVWRVYQNSMQYRGVKLDNKIMFGYVGLMNCIMVVLLAIWLGAFSPEPQACAEFRCTSPTSVMAYVSFFYVALLSILTLVIAFLARNVPSVGGESVAILITVSFTFFAIILVGILVVSGAVSLVLESFLISFAIFWCSIIALISIVYRKWIWVNFSAQEVQAMFLRTNMSTMGGGSSRYSDNSPHARSGPSYFTKQPTSTSSESRPHMFAPGANKPFSTWSAQPPKPTIYSESQTLRGTSTGTQSAETSSDAEFNPAEDIIVTNLDDGSKLLSDGMHQKRTQAPPPIMHDLHSLMEDEATINTVERPNHQVPQQAPKAHVVDEATLEVIRRRGFKIGEENDWEEFVDRETGESFFLNSSTGQVSHIHPNELKEMSMV